MPVSQLDDFRAMAASGALSEDPGPHQTNGCRPRTLAIPPSLFSTPQGAFSKRDLYHLVLLPFLTVIAWSLPDPICAAFCRRLSTLLYRIRPKRYGGYRQVFSLLPGEQGKAASQDLLIPEAIAMRQLERLQLLRYHRPGGWRPRIELRGKEHIDRALAAGKGAILWGPHSPFSEVAFKMALRQNGYADWHLSRPDHGHFSSTRFGVRFLNPIRIKIEDRYLAERVIIDPADPTSGLATLAGLLAENRLISVTVQGFASSVTLVSYGNGELPLPSGPALLAIKTGAALLPIFTERRPDGSFLVTVEAALDAPATARFTERVTQMLCRQGTIMFAYFKRLPSQYHYAYLHHVTELLGQQVDKSAA